MSLCQKENIDQNLQAKLKLEESEKKLYFIQNDFEKTTRNLQDEIKIKDKEKVLYFSFIIKYLLFLKTELHNIISKQELKNSELASKHAKEIEHLNKEKEHLNKEKETIIKSLNLEITEKNAEIHKLQDNHSKTKT